MKVLLVEDEVGISKPLCAMLARNNIHADAVYDGLSGYIQASKDIYDVIVLDIMLPEMDGITVLKKLRADKVLTPVMLLTAKDSIDDKVTGLEYGADDYLTKPFSTEELIARIKALARRRGDVFTEREYSFGDIIFNANNGELTVNGMLEELTSKEAHLLEILMKNAGSVISKDYLLDTVWGIDSEAIENTVEIYIHYLRKKLQNSAKVRIVTLRGMGYTLKEDKNAR
ncbi:MAG: response regulator transcription factor [Clostridiales bacterium]|nr:response regulator transcription factor [Clostridiales bacterium]